MKKTIFIITTLIISAMLNKLPAQKLNYEKAGLPDPYEKYKFSAVQIDSLIDIIKNGNRAQQRAAIFSIDIANDGDYLELKEINKIAPNLIFLLNNTPIEQPSYENNHNPLHALIIGCLGRLGDNKAADAVWEVFSNEQEDTVSRRQALIVLGVFKDARVEAAALMGLESKDWNMRRACIGVAGNLRSVRGIVPILNIMKEITSFTKYPPELSMAYGHVPAYKSLLIYCQHALMNIGTEAVPSLMEALKDPNIKYRNWAAYTLGSIKRSEYNEEVGPVLIEALKTADDEWLQDAVLGVIGELGYKNAISVLINMLKGNKKQKYSISAVYASLKKLDVDIERVTWKDKTGQWHAKYVIIDEKGVKTEIIEEQELPKEIPYKTAPRNN